MTELSSAYWEGAARGLLVVQRCAACGTLHHYPRMICSNCYSFELVPQEVHSFGEVHSWTVTHHVFDPALADEVPYTLVTVDMAENVRMLGRYTGTVPLQVGSRVRLEFVGVDGELPMPLFTPVEH